MLVPRKWFFFSVKNFLKLIGLTECGFFFFYLPSPSKPSDESTVNLIQVYYCKQIPVYTNTKVRVIHKLSLLEKGFNNDL